MAHFDEKSGIVPCLTPWGKWYQTMEEIFIEVNVPEGTTSKMVKVIFGPKQLACTVRGEELIKVCSRTLGNIHLNEDLLHGLIPLTPWGQAYC